MIIPHSPAAIQQAAEILRAGGVVAFPTETVYGLGADALNAEAAARIFEIKGRPRFDPLIVHVTDVAAARELVADFPPQAARLAEQFWPGPLTLVLPKQPQVPELVTAGLPTVAVRVPAHPVARELLQAAGCPIAAPSANRFGCVSPTRAEHVAEQLGAAVELILDGGPCDVGLESTIVSLADPASPVLLRPGGLPLEELQSVLGPITIATDDAQPVAPGMLPRHYAPRTRVVVVDRLDDLTAEQRTGRVGVLSLDPVAADFAAVEVLSPSGDLREAATRLFAAMHRLDAQSLDRIIALRVPDEGLGRAINDRLRRAR